MKPSSSRTYINEKTISAMVRSTDSGAGAYNGRRGRMDAAAEGARFIAQSLNDFSLKHAIDRELKRLSREIANAIAASGSAVVAVSVDAMSSPGNVGMVVARSVSSAFVLPCPNGNPQQAIQAWVRKPKFEKVRPPHVQLETRFLIIAPKGP